jgi:hypothetical protein
MAVDNGTVDTSTGDTSNGTAGGYAWLAGLPGELAAQRRVMSGLLGWSAATPLVTSLSVGCSLGRGAADALSDIDAALGLGCERGPGGAGQVLAIEDELVAALPGFGAVIDVLRHRTGPPDRFIRRVFAQFGDGTQLDLAIMAEPEVRRGAAAPDFVSLDQAAQPPGLRRPPSRPASPSPGPAGDGHRSADAVTADQIREWAFSGWCALADTAKYLRRGSLWEAHDKLHEARHQIWALWAAAEGALYPWHGLSQVLDHDPGRLPPGIEATVAVLDTADLRRAARASAAVLSAVSEAAARRQPAGLPDAMARYVTGLLGERPAPGPP